MGTLLGEDDPKATDRCTALLKSPDQSTKPASITVLLADGSASAFARPGAAKRDDWASRLAEDLPQNGRDLVAVGLFGGAVDWQTKVVTPGKSNDAQRTKVDLGDAKDCLTRDLSSAMTTVPSKPQTDVLRALAEGAEYVKEWPGAKSIYLATDGLSNTGCADLRAAPIGDQSAIADIVSGCAPELPRLDNTYTVHFIGVGNSATGWADIKTPQRTWISSLWKALCAATTATCTEPDSAKPATIDTSGIKPAADNDVRMPAIKVIKGNPTVVTVPSSLLFDVDKYSLASGRSQDALEEVYKFLNQLRPKRIEVDGHTDSTGTPEHNRTLSENRAQAVAVQLRAQNFTNITTKGYAAEQPSCTPEYRNGKPDPIAMACNRRVEILVYN